MAHIIRLLTTYDKVCTQNKHKLSPLVQRVLIIKKETDSLKSEIYLDLRGNSQLSSASEKLNDDVVGDITEAISQYPIVWGIDFSYNVIANAGADMVAVFLKTSKTIDELRLSFNEIGHEGAVEIASALQMNDSLVTLHLTGNKIGKLGGLALAEMLQVNTRLAELDLGDCDLTMDAMIALATATRRSRSLKRLSLNRPLLHGRQEEHIVHIGNMLKVNKSLEELHLQKCEVWDFGVERLCDGLIDNPVLKVLDLGCNHITRDGAKRFAKLLELNTPLQVLILNKNSLQCEGAGYLAKALAHINFTLKTLDVSYNRIESDGLVSLAESLKSNSTLSDIHVWGNSFDNASGSAFRHLFEQRRLEEKNSDIRPYVVDHDTLVAEVSHGYRRYFYWQPIYGENAPPPREIMAE